MPADMRALPALIAAAATLIGCGGGTPPVHVEGPSGLGPERAGSVAALAQCHDWEEWSADQRLAAIEDIREQLNQSGNLEPQPDLADDEAYDLFQRTCSRPFAIGFRLYRVYSRAGAFSSLAPPGE